MHRGIEPEHSKIGIFPDASVPVSCRFCMILIFVDTNDVALFENLYDIIDL
jgi:hypothetical protein